MINRWFKHLTAAPLATRRRFPGHVLQAIEKTITTVEAQHAGEIRFVIETSLDFAALRAGRSPRERAIEVFSRQRVWDTEHNSGLLIYLLLADRAVEIVADRGLCKKEISRAWPDLLGTLREALSAGQFEAGCLGAIDTAGHLMRQYFPTAEPGKNELPNDVEWL